MLVGRLLVKFLLRVLKPVMDLETLVTCWRCRSVAGNTGPSGFWRWPGRPGRTSWWSPADGPATSYQPLWWPPGCPQCGCWRSLPRPGPEWNHQLPSKTRIKTDPKLPSKTLTWNILSFQRFGLPGGINPVCFLRSTIRRSIFSSRSMMRTTDTTMVGSRRTVTIDRCRTIHSCLASSSDNAWTFRGRRQRSRDLHQRSAEAKPVELKQLTRCSWAMVNVS